MRSLAVAMLLAATAHAQGGPPTVPATTWHLEVVYDRGWFGTHGVDPDGRHLGLRWTREPAREGAVVILRRKLPPGTDSEPHAARTIDRIGPLLVPAFVYPTSPHEYHPAFDAKANPIPPGTRVGDWTVVASVDSDPETPVVDEVESGVAYEYALLPATRADKPDTYDAFGDAIVTGAESAHTAWFDKRRWLHLALIGTVALALAAFTWLAKRRELFVRRLAAVDAIEDAVGRSTEMGRPILYVTGVYETQDIQTLASLLILGHVAKMAAEYETELRVANAYPLTMVIAEEIVRQAYANAGRADAHRPEHVLFITSEQFAFAAGVNGMMLRERPATNIFFGKFFAESLMLAETGYLTGAVQIAGTAELTQLPFFISACDYTLIGEELFAASAYLTREPNQLALLKAGDVMKIVIAVLIVGFTVCATIASYDYYPFTRFSIEDVMP
jgi:hypothetical protein